MVRAHPEENFFFLRLIIKSRSEKPDGFGNHSEIFENSTFVCSDEILMITICALYFILVLLFSSLFWSEFCQRSRLQRNFWRILKEFQSYLVSTVRILQRFLEHTASAKMFLQKWFDPTFNMFVRCFHEFRIYETTNFFEEMFLVFYWDQKSC